MKNITRNSSLLAACVVLLVVAGCDNDGDLPGLKCFLKSATYSSSGSGYDFAIVYGSDGKVSAFEVHQPNGQGGTIVTTLTATYDGNGRISKFEIMGGSRVDFTYDAKGNLTREDDYEDGAQTGRKQYEYNSAGQLVREDTYRVHSGGTDKEYSETFEYPNTSGSNPNRSRSYSGSGMALGYADYEYDDRPTPYAELNIPLDLFGDPGNPANNVTRRTSKSTSGSVENTSIFTYQYNDDGYPTSLEEKMSFPSSPTTVTSNKTFTYDCK